MPKTNTTRPAGVLFFAVLFSAASSSWAGDASRPHHSSGVNATTTSTEKLENDLLGSYSCRATFKGIPMLANMSLPPFGCKIYRDSIGELKLNSHSPYGSRIFGTIKNQNPKGFTICGDYRYFITSVTIRAQMHLQPNGTFAGIGSVESSDPDLPKVEYTLTLERAH